MTRTPESDFYNGMEFVAATGTGDRARGAYREDDITVFGVVQGESGVVGSSCFSPPLQRAQRWATRPSLQKTQRWATRRFAKVGHPGSCG